jgi:hypothetical protein
MQPSRVIVLALLIACSLDRHPAPGSTHAPAEHGHVQAPPEHEDAATVMSDAADETDRGTPPAVFDAAPRSSGSGHSTHADAGHSTHADAGTNHGPPTAPSDAAVHDAAVAPPMTPAVSDPPDSGVDAAIDASAPTDALRGQLIALLGAAEFMRNERAIVGIVAVLTTQAETPGDVDQILIALKDSGRCAVFGAVVCAGACSVIAQRCMMCAPDATCAADLQSLCGSTATTCR